MPAPSTPEYLTDRAIAARFSISRSTVWRWFYRGVLPPPVRIGACTRWRLSDILAAEEAMRGAA
jgi:prophage regulatory protein